MACNCECFKLNSRWQEVKRQHNVINHISTEVVTTGEVYKNEFPPIMPNFKRSISNVNRPRSRNYGSYERYNFHNKESVKRFYNTNERDDYTYPEQDSHNIRRDTMLRKRGCYNCGEMNHRQAQCRYDHRLKCGNCHLYGHKQRVCSFNRD